MFVEEHDDVLLGLEVGGCEDREVWLISCGTEGNPNLFEAKIGETVIDFGTNCFCRNLSWELIHR